MTTPEAFRRRQLIEAWVVGGFLLIFGAFTVGIAIYGYQQDREADRRDAAADVREDARQACFQRYTVANSKIAEFRAKVVEREARNDSRFLLNATRPGQDMTGFQRERARYEREVARIAKARADNPVRPFPVGRCR